nr:alpha-mannosidase [Ktedonobacterales bacterium]
GEITSCVDKRVLGGRELLPVGARANEPRIFEDRPRHFDAWDIDAGYERKRYEAGPAEMALVETGPLRATLRITRRVLSSTIEQRISIYRALAQIDFATRIDWHEHHLLLKVAFPLDLRATHATYEVQYGAVERPTHRNTSWDQARFEVPAHRWVDLSEADYGVSLLNDGRYGHDVRENVLRLTLLRSPTSPDPEADQGLHELTYSLFPHLGDWRAGGTVAAAYALNRPIRVRLTPGEAGPASATPPLPPGIGLFTAEPASVVVEAVKRADDGEGLIVRLYEAHGARCLARIASLAPLAAVTECDLLERPFAAGASPAEAAWRASPVASRDDPRWDAAGWSCALRPFEVRTFRLRCAPLR